MAKVSIENLSSERWILSATILGSSLAFIDGTVINVALPALQANLNASVVDVQWVVESYSLFLSALLLVGGSLGDRFGRRLIYTIGVAIFAIASVWCGLSPNIKQLIFARAIQGIGGALLVPGSLAIISACFSEDRRGKAIGTWSGFTAITTAVGPILGGWFIDHFSWRGAFFINIPIAIAVIIIAITHVPETRDEQGSNRLDWWGALLATLGLGLLIYGLIESSRRGFDHTVVFSIVFGTITLGIFLFVESRIKDPMLPLELFRSKNFCGANLLTLFLYAALGGAFFFLPLNLIQVQHYSATAAGTSFIPMILLMFFLSRWAGGLVQRYGSRLPLTIGPLIVSVAFLLFAIPGINKNYWTSFFPAIVTLGLGMSISVAPLTTTVMNSVPQHQSGIASGINNAVSRAAGLLAIAVFGIIMLHVFNNALDKNLQHVGISPDVVPQEERVKLAAMKMPKIQSMVDQSFVSGFRIVTLVAAGLAAASAISARLLIEEKKRELHNVK
jgi:EmrB/QacA subfamily drug resistance transporter